MKLALVTQHFAPHFEGGTERVVRAQAQALAELGHDVCIVAGTDRPHAGRDVERSELDALPVAHLPRHPDETYDLTLARERLERLVAAEVAGCDLVHLHHWSTLSARLVRTLQQPVVVSLHDLFVTCPRFFRSSPDPGIVCPVGPEELDACVACIRPDAPGHGAEELERGLAERRAGLTAELDAAARIVAPSRSHAERVRHLLGRDDLGIEVVPNGLCAPLERVPRRGRTPGEPLRVLHPGHRTRAKGTADLVRALAAVADLRPGAVALTLAGDCVEEGFDEELRRAAGALPLSVRGSYDAALLSTLAREADLVALPSLALESYGLVVDEALALGLPVWVSDRGALGERVGAAGRVLPAGDPSAWTEAFVAVVDDPAELEAERDAVPARVRSARDAAADLVELYEGVLGEAR